MLNFAIMRHWQNWAIVLFVLIVACFAVNQIAKLVIKNGDE